MQRKSCKVRFVDEMIIYIFWWNGWLIDNLGLSTKLVYIMLEYAQINIHLRMSLYMVFHVQLSIPENVASISYIHT